MSDMAGTAGKGSGSAQRELPKYNSTTQRTSELPSAIAKPMAIVVDNLSVFFLAEGEQG